MPPHHASPPTPPLPSPPVKQAIEPNLPRSELLKRLLLLLARAARAHAEPRGPDDATRRRDRADEETAGRRRDAARAQQGEGRHRAICVVEIGDGDRERGDLGDGKRKEERWDGERREMDGWMEVGERLVV